VSTKLLLDGQSITSEADFHSAVDAAARSAGITFYGRNLDALWDLIRGLLPLPVEVRWVHANHSRMVLGDRYEQIVSLLREAERECGTSFNVTIEP
jgi:ribonuclease inhibitor